MTSTHLGVGARAGAAGGTTGRVKRPIVYCRRCLMPETKPDILFDDDGVCSACRHFEQRAAVDWDARRGELLEILDRYRSPDGSNYDCIVPVSGGKDSTAQTLRMLELGMNPLCVTATTDQLSDIGRRNIENLKAQGVDFVEYTTNLVVRRKINKLALSEVGDISWPEHVAIFTIPVRVAVQTGVKLIVWGENPQNEYGGPAAAATDNALTRRWLEEFGGLLGLRVSDLVARDGIEAKHLVPYTYPSDDELARSGVTGVFLGYYLEWDGLLNALYAQGHGFESYPQAVEGSIVNYENLDNYQTGIHDYFKFLKYGFGRATDLACMWIRRGRISRADALALVRKHDGKFPSTYLGAPIEQVLDAIGMTHDEFVQVCDRFTNKRLFETDRHGELVREADGSLIKINHDNVATVVASGAESWAAVQRVAIVDYGLCNLDSVRRALEEVGARSFVTDDPSDLDAADRIVLPGVGAFPDAMRNLRAHHLDDALTKLVIDEGVPFLGVCLGMQLIAALGTEGGECEGLGWIDARVTRFAPPTPATRVPHVGWNEVHLDRACPLFDGIPDGADFYFVHSFHMRCADDADVVATTPYCDGFTSVVGRDHVFGVQFHPEKSQRNGLQLLRNFLAA